MVILLAVVKITWKMIRSLLFLFSRGKYHCRIWHLPFIKNAHSFLLFFNNRRNVLDAQLISTKTRNVNTPFSTQVTKTDILSALISTDVFILHLLFQLKALRKFNYKGTYRGITNRTKLSERDFRQYLLQFEQDLDVLCLFQRIFKQLSTREQRGWLLHQLNSFVTNDTIFNYGFCLCTSLTYKQNSPNKADNCWQMDHEC